MKLPELLTIQFPLILVIQGVQLEKSTGRLGVNSGWDTANPQQPEYTTMDDPRYSVQLPKGRFLQATYSFIHIGVGQFRDEGGAPGAWETLAEAEVGGVVIAVEFYSGDDKEEDKKGRRQGKMNS
ncbi:MAG: hypothetical protein NXY57DRAFT_1040252 [Lentinula lateritia]|nr:MAG: hypothetical protein NXY57DRAFT_1040252 [Lentinula lateritia]